MVNLRSYMSITQTLLVFFGNYAVQIPGQNWVTMPLKAHAHTSSPEGMQMSQHAVVACS